MCYDISFATTAETIADYLPNLKFNGQVELGFDYTHVVAHAFPKYPIVLFENGEYHVQLMEWGLIAPYMDTPEKIKKGRNFMLNAKSEKLIEKGTVWNRLRKKRCLIPVTGIYEHREVVGMKNKIPYFVKIKSRDMFFLPGLYNHSPLADPETGEMKPTFTLLTRKANEVMSQIHNGGDNKFRMPLFLNADNEMKWLNPEVTDEQLAEIVSYEIDSDELSWYPVYSIRGRTPRPDGQPKNAKYEYENLPPLAIEEP